MMMFHKSQRNDLIVAIVALPLYIAGIGWYGWKTGVILLASVAAGLLTAEVSRRLGKNKMIYYPFYLWILFPLVLPPAFPIIPAVIGIIFSQIVCITFFGGHGRQIVSPVAICWAFCLLSFTAIFNESYVFPFNSFSEGFRHWSAGLPTVDNPAALFSGELKEFLPFILTGRFPQPLGNAFPPLVILLGITLLILRAVDFRISLAFLLTYGIGFVILSLMPEARANPADLFIGNLGLAAFFILPDNRSISRTHSGRWITGIIAGVCGIVINYFSAYSDGIIFAVILANIFSGIVDVLVLRNKREAPV